MAFGLQGLLAPVWGLVADGIGGRSALYIVGLGCCRRDNADGALASQSAHIPPEPGTAAAIASEQSVQSDTNHSDTAQPEPGSAPSPAISPLFAALMEGQKPR